MLTQGSFHVFQEAEKLVSAVIPKHLADAAPEVAVYLKESVGNSTRIDYGTGTWACTLAKAGRDLWNWVLYLFKSIITTIFRASLK